MSTNHATRKLLRETISDPQTPEWGRATLMVLRDLCGELDRHLDSHRRTGKLVWALLVPSGSAVVIASVWFIIQSL